MALSMSMDVLVVSMDDSIDASLKRVAEEHGWAQMHCPSLRQATRQIMACHPRVVIVQVSKITDAALQLVRILQAGWRKVALIVTARHHSEDLEREARMAGCTAYLTEGQTTAMVDQYVEAVIGPVHANVPAASRTGNLNAARLNPDRPADA